MLSLLMSFENLESSQKQGHNLLLRSSPRGIQLKLQQLACNLPGEKKVAGIKACWRQHAQTNAHWQAALSLQLTNFIFKQRLAKGL